MEQDDDGFYWLGTEEGLYRFDGRQAVKINYLTGDSLSPNAAIIRDLCIDRKNRRIWLATEQGVFRYDPHTGLSEHLQAKDFFEPKDIRGESSRIVFTDRQGETWSDFGAYGIVRLPAKGKKTEAFFLPLSEKEKAAGIDQRMANTPMAFAQDPNHDNLLWVATRRGLLKFDKAAGKLKRFVYFTANPDMLPNANAMPCIYAHPNGKVYLGTWNAGLLVFDPAKQSFTPFFQTGQGWTTMNALNRVTRILPDGKGNLWVSGSPGVSLFDVERQTFTSAPVPNTAFDFKDRAGNYWQYRPAFRLYHHVKNQISKYTFPPEVRCRTQISAIPFDTLNRQAYLRSLCKGGFWALHVDRLSWQHFPMPNKEGEKTLNAYGESAAGFWVTDENNRLFLRAPGNNRFVQQPVSFPANPGNLLLECRPDGQVFISGHEGYLFWLQPGSDQPKIYTKHNVGEPGQDHFSGTSAVTFDQLGRLWLSTTGGFSIFSPEENRFIHISKKSGANHLSVYNGFLLGANKRMWTSSHDEIGWLDPLKPEAGLQRRYGKSNGFAYTNINLVFQERSYLWLTTNEGLVRFDPENGTHRLFEQIKTRNIEPIGGGKVISAWDGAYAIFHLDSLKPNEEQPKPYATWFKIFENRRAIPGSPFAPDEIRLAPEENFFSIGFSALGLYDAHKIRFAYRLEGVDRDWIYPEENEHAASYTNIAGGNYVFRLKTTNSRGAWTEQTFGLRIHVGTPWYETALARLLFLLLLGGFLFGAYQFQKRRWALDATLRLKEQERQRLAELDAFKTRFFTNITHEFRTPLTVITGLAEELQDTLAQWEARPAEEAAGSGKTPDIALLRSNSDAIRRNGQDLLRLVNQMLDLARLEAGSLTLHYQQADVMQFLKITAASYQSLAQLKRQHLVCVTDPDTFLMDFDPQRLQEITGNLLSNALKFTPESGSVKVFAKAAGQTLNIIVEDTGMGIPESEQPRIFDRFYRSGTSDTGYQEGSGIGLALVKELVTCMGGSIRVESMPGEGSKFIVTLPVTNKSPLATLQYSNLRTIQPSNSPTLEPSNLPTLEPSNPALPLLLYVEDNPDLTRYVQQLLAGAYQVLTARDGQEGLALALEQVPDLVLSDVMMPGMDGFELCRRLKTDRLSSHIPVVLLTARATVPDKVEGLQQGADAYLPKPFERAELFATLHNLLENRRRLSDYFNAAAPLPETAPSDAAAEHAFLQTVRQLLDAHLSDERYDMTNLSRDLAMSRMQLHRKISALTGHPAAHFARAHRLQKARHLLETTDLNVSEIAYATGFSDHAWFSRSFREMFGKTPSEMRK